MWSTPEGRRAAITKEVFDYLVAVQEYFTVQQHATIVRRDLSAPQTCPAHVAYRRCKEWGFPYNGGWADQPAGFMKDVWAAEAGVRRFNALQNRRTLNAQQNAVE